MRFQSVPCTNSKQTTITSTTTAAEIPTTIWKRKQTTTEDQHVSATHIESTSKKAQHIRDEGNEAITPFPT